MNTLKGMNYLDKMNNLDVITRIAKRFPHPWINGWQTEVDSLIHIKRCDVTIQNLTSCVALKTRQMTNLDCDWTTSKKFVANKNRKETTLAAQTVLAPSKVCCKLCKSSHYLNQCKRFRKFTYDERIKFVNENKLCCSCLEFGHFVHNCSRKDSCKKPDCKGRHTTLLHPPETPISADSSSPSSASTATISSSSQHVAVSNGYVDTSADNRSFLPIVPVKVRLKNSKQSIVTQAFLDTGSTSSFITCDLIDKLQVHKTPIVEVTTVTINKNKETRKPKVISNWEISELSEFSYVFHLQPLLSIQCLPASRNDAPTQEDISEFPEFDEIFLPSVDVDVGLLIGNDNRYILKPQSIINTALGHYATRTSVGWVVNCSKKDKSVTHCKNFFIKSNTGFVQPMCSLCTDVVDTVHNTNSLSREQHWFMEMVKTSVRHLKNNHYEIALPLRNRNLRLPVNKSLAEQRACYLKRKFLKNPTFFEQYKQFVEEMIDQGYAENVEGEEGEEGKTWYIPHHGVYHNNKPGKLRVVFDCSAKYEGTCLNDHPLPGPDITNSLIGVLQRFRRELIGFQGDIQGMFHQVQVPPDDRDLLRVLWWEDSSLENDLQSYRMCVYLFGTVSSPSCANFALKQTAMDHEKEISPAAIDTIRNCFYVDDCLASAPTEKEATALLHEISKLLSTGGFKITKWTSNSRKEIESVPPQERSKELKDLNLSRDPLPKKQFLGLRWDVEADTLCFRVKLNDKPMSRRGILSIVNSVYDPFAFGAPAIQPMKVLLQDICKLNLDWDQDIPHEMQRKWMDWLQHLPSLATFQIPRCIKPANFSNIKSAQIHHFSDASEKSYGYAAYLRLINEQDQIYCSLIMGKTRLSPLKTLTIPRLELCAATIASQFELDLRRELHLPFELQPSIFWTDSTTVSRYVNNKTKVYHTFVANRVQTIRNNSEPSQWKYVSSNDNRADLPSLGLKIKNFLRNKQWKNGPDFLWQSESDWPPQPKLYSEGSPDPEEKKSATLSCSILLESDSDFYDSLFSRFSNWQKLLRVCAIILRYKRLFLSKIKSRHNTDTPIKCNSPKTCALSVADINESEHFIFFYLLQQVFSEEIQALKASKLIKTSSKLRKLNPFLIDSLLRVGGRIKQATLPYNQKHPIILSSYSHVTSLLIKSAHVSLGHVGRQHVLSYLRESFWILKANSSVRKVLSECVTCRKLYAPAEVQLMAELPKERLTPNEPSFSHVGTDLFGPFLTKTNRSRTKRYGVIFTCLAVRAIHLEIAYSLDTSSFIQALRRFIARRGPVVEIKSYNGKKRFHIRATVAL